MSKFTGQLAKIQSITADTNVISDILFHNLYFQPMLDAKGKIPDSEQEYFHRCVASRRAVFIMLDFAVERVGLKVVYRELLVKPPLHMLYRNLFPAEAKIDRRAKSLAEKYASSFSIGAADATIVALCATNNIDVLLTWNRDHLLKSNAIQKIEAANKASGLNTPEIITPKAFMERLMLTDKKHLALSPTPVLRVYRVETFLSKFGL